MNFETWSPFYQTILNRFEFSEEKDVKTTVWLSKVTENIKTTSVGESIESIKSILNAVIQGKRIVICGNAPSLESEFLTYLNEYGTENEIYIAADGAATVLLKTGKVPDIIVTDLDGRHPNDAIKEIEAADKGALLLIHAHGDNLDKLEKYLPAFSDKIEKNKAIPTCQCRPTDYVYNFGGFTDGDRCVFLADEFGAESMILLGFDFDDPDVSPLKKKKLECAKQLIQMIQKKNSGIKFFDEI
ncbi:DUF115 domain-containing protein [Methanimicrococcus sp. OttesenSCG-928-J09]|nr:DUF115 domain-containing protein [Methanimicrococcus sp. OttesenSCG-928-J09]